MTRESKVAIILGFAVVLVVAALISDHFSHARLARTDNSITLGKPDDFGAGPNGLTIPIGDTPRVPINEPLAVDPKGTTNDRPNAAGTKGAPDGKSVKPDEIHMGPKEKQPAAGDPSKSPVKPDDNENRPSPYGDGATPPPQAIASDLPFTDKKAKPYQVQENDSLYRIAKANYGDGSLWQELADYNKSKVGANNAVRAGVTITIPPKEVLLGKAQLRPDEPVKTGTKPVSRVALNDDKPLSTKDRSKPTDTAAKYVMYTIRKGDHLSTISQRLLGSSRRVDEILRLNPSLDDEDSIREGLVIKLPKN